MSVQVPPDIGVCSALGLPVQFALGAHAGGGEAAEGLVVRRGWQAPSHAQQRHATSLEGSEGKMVLWDNLICDRSRTHCGHDAGQDNLEVPFTSPDGSCEFPGSEISLSSRSHQ